MGGTERPRSIQRHDMAMADIGFGMPLFDKVEFFFDR
jgi:hypothetical protein